MKGAIHLIWIVALLLAACTARPNIVPLPVIDGPVTLRVVHAVNPRLPAMDAGQRTRLLLETAKTVKAHFGVELRFEDRGETPIDELFAALPEEKRRERQALIYDFKGGGGDRGRLLAAMKETLAQYQGPIAEPIAYARPYLAVPLKEESLDGLAAALTDTLLTRLNSWREITLADGRPLIDDAPYNEWALWDALGYGPLPFDLVITNQLMASAEYLDQDVHTALRGGITVGTTTNSEKSRYGTVVFWSTFPFTTDTPALTRLRDGERYSDEEAARLSGTYLAHEIGHQLFHLGHPFSRPECVMRPVELLRFRAWHKALDPTACPIGSGPQMERGAVEIRY